MIKCLLKFLVVFVLCCNALNGLAQSSVSENYDKKQEKGSSLKIGVNYLNNYVFKGRSDSVRTAVISPNAKYTFESGFFLSGSVDFVPDNRSKKVSGGDLSVGYSFDLTEHLDGEASITKLFYNSSSPQVASSQSVNFNASLSYEIEQLLSPFVSVDYAINKKGYGSDVFITAGLGHEFTVKSIFGTTDLFTVSPSVSLNTGTQNFYDAFLLRRKQGLTTLQAKEIESQKQELSKFKLLNYEFSVPVVYKIDHFIVSFVPSYSIVQNKLPAVIRSKLSDKDALFYFEAGIAFKF
jgi:hypothetical protein